ncbi:MAG TPA: hypothetical protein PKN44_16135, partial [Bacteroidales bacterium]|nr:hypothetical protein [Bacteroidales bacterium]
MIPVWILWNVLFASALFFPMMPTTSPCSTSNETSFSAQNSCGGLWDENRRNGAFTELAIASR